MIIKVLQDFRDKQDDLKTKTAGAIMEVSEARGRQLITSGFAEEIKEKKAKEGSKK